MNLPLKLLDQFLQLSDERVFFDHHRLLMLTCSTLNRQLELYPRERLHHLWRKVGKQVEIKRR